MILRIQGSPDPGENRDFEVRFGPDFHTFGDTILSILRTPSLPDENGSCE